MKNKIKYGARALERTDSIKASSDRRIRFYQGNTESNSILDLSQLFEIRAS